MKKQAQFYAETPEEHKAIIALLYSHGYRKARYTAEQCHADLAEYTHLVIFGDGIIGGNYSWQDDRGPQFIVSDTSIGELVEFLTEKPSMLVHNFGDHTAEVFADEIFIGGPDVMVQFDRVKEIYDIITTKSKPFDELHITVKNDEERRFLIHALSSFGYTNRYLGTIAAWCDHYSEENYRSIVVYGNTKICGANYTYREYVGRTEYVFSRDMDELYPILMGGSPTKIEIEDIAGFGVEIHKDTVRVGCQSITYDKIKESYAAMIELQG